MLYINLTSNVNPGGQQFTCDGTWQRETAANTPTTTVANGVVYIATRGSGAAQAVSAYIDGVQLEARPYATPYVETNGAAASRIDARVQAPATSLNTTKSWIAMRLRAGWASGALTEPFGFAWADSTGEYIVVDYYAGNWRVLRRSALSGGPATKAQTLAAGDLVTVVAKWTATNVSISVNGSAFTTVSNTAIPTLAAANFDLGSGGGAFASSRLNSDILWSAGGSGTPSDADAAALNALGNSDPTTSSLPGTARTTFTWNGVGTAYQTATWSG